MNHQDAELTEVVVVLDDLNDEQTGGVVAGLKAAGLDVAKVDHDEGLVEGTVESTKVHDLKRVEHVRYVRSVLTFTVDYPPGDPRDKDGPEEED